MHVPWCARRCSYCDFNTYVDRSGGQAGPGGSPASNALDDTVRDLELELALLGNLIGDRPSRVDTLFFGGGTPTLLAPEVLGRLIGSVRDRFGLEPLAEVTVEANPETLDPPILARLREAGVNRLSIGQQSAVESVLRVLGREHDAERGFRAVEWARSAGFDNVSLDLIYGAPGESSDDWRQSVAAAVDSGADHVSAYALKIEAGTALGAARLRGEVEDPDPDLLADRYEMADRVLSDSGRPWYEISNWSRPDRCCQHNLGYWHGDDWLGVGPGAHSHVSGVRWWNVRNPRRAAARLAAGRLPVDSGEVPDREARDLERVMLGIRLREGMGTDGFSGRVVSELVTDGLLQSEDARAGKAVLTRQGRLLADAVTRRLSG